MAEISPPSSLAQLRARLGPWNRRATVITLIVLVLAALIAWSMRPLPAPADFAVVTKGDLIVSVDDEGETRVKDVYIVSAPVAGRVERINLDVGDTVVAGETVLALFQPQDPVLLDARARSEAEAGVSLAEAELTRARAQLEFARLELRRTEQLHRDDTVSEAALDKAKLGVKTAQALADQAAASVAKRRTDLENARGAIAQAGSSRAPGMKLSFIPVRAPVSGRVLRRMQQSEGLLAAGTPLLEIGDPANLEIVTDYLSGDAVKVHAGDDVRIEEWGGPTPLTGKVKRVEPFGFTKISALGVEEQRVNVISDFTSPASEWKTLGHGYRVVTKIVIEHRPNVVKVPVGALFRTGPDWSVFVKDGNGDGGRARLRLVKVGSRNTLEAEITDGLRDGETVIIHPSDKVADGARVVARES